MTKLPSNKSIFLSIFVLLLFYNLLFYSGVYHRLEQSHYSWEQMTILDSIKSVKLIAVSQKNMDFLTSYKLLLSPKKTYILVNSEQTYPFRFKYTTKHHDTLRFFGLRWIKGMPKDFTKKYILQIVDLPMKKAYKEK